MKKNKIIYSIVTVLLVTAFVKPIDIQAIDFSKEEEKYMQLCSSSKLKSNQSTCRQFNDYLKKKNKDLKSSINDTQGKIDSTQANLDGVVSQIATLNNEIEKKQDEINYLENSINELQASITKKENDMKDRMYAMQTYNNSNSYVDFIFGAESFSDFFSRIQSVNELTAYDEDLVQQISDEKKQVESQKATVETAKANIESQKSQQVALQNQYQSLINQQKQTLENQKAEQSKISNTQSSMDSYFSSLVAQQQAQQSSSSSSGSSSSSSGSTSRPIYSQNIPTTNKYGSIVVSAARSKLGCPYVWGASGPNTFDCSGLVMWCYAQAGVSLDHYSGSQHTSGAILPLSQAQPGDILWKSGHVGIYIGGGQYIHAPQTGDVVKIASNYTRFTCAVRPY